MFDLAWYLNDKLRKSQDANSSTHTTEVGMYYTKCTQLLSKQISEVNGKKMADIEPDKMSSPMFLKSDEMATPLFPKQEQPFCPGTSLIMIKVYS